jgi:hypothetical protein
MNGNDITSGTSYSLKFTKEKDGKGAFQQSYTIPPFPTQTFTGTYTLTEDTKIVLTFSNDMDVLDVLEYSKTDLKVRDLENVTWELKKQ